MIPLMTDLDNSLIRILFHSPGSALLGADAFS